MDGKVREKLSFLMGVIIAVADIYWTYTSYFDTLWLALGVIILAADLFWIYLDW